MPEFAYELKIPKERIAVLIGKKGEIKVQLEKETKTKIKVDSKEGDVFITGEDALNLYTVREIVRAVGRGFNPDIALLLLKQDYSFEIIDISDYVSHKDHIKRLKGRVIGSEGKSRKTIESLTDTNISVYGKTVGIIGQAENVDSARRAIESLLKGSEHAKVYNWLEKKRREFKRQEMTGI
jgi:ribosomal RNA assembly protein